MSVVVVVISTSFVGYGVRSFFAKLFSLNNNFSLELLSAVPRATLTPLSCTPNFPRAQYLDIRTPMHELIVK